MAFLIAMAFQIAGFTNCLEFKRCGIQRSFPVVDGSSLIEKVTDILVRVPTCVVEILCLNCKWIIHNRLLGVHLLNICIWWCRRLIICTQSIVVHALLHRAHFELYLFIIQMNTVSNEYILRTHFLVHT